MSQSKKPDLVEREAVKKLIDDMLVAIKEDKVPADLPCGRSASRYVDFRELGR